MRGKPRRLRRGGCHQRLTPSLAEYLRDPVETVLDEVAVPDAADADLDRFRDVMIADGTVLRLHEFLSDEYEARHERQAGAKLHLLHNATDQTIERLDVTDEKTHDSTLFKTGSWLHAQRSSIGQMVLRLAGVSLNSHRSLLGNGLLKKCEQNPIEDVWIILVGVVSRIRDHLVATVRFPVGPIRGRL